MSLDLASQIRLIHGGCQEKPRRRELAALCCHASACVCKQSTLDSRFRLSSPDQRILQQSVCNDIKNTNAMAVSSRPAILGGLPEIWCIGWDCGFALIPMLTQGFLNSEELECSPGWTELYTNQDPVPQLICGKNV